ncbi:MAG: DMT family transporter [Chloroflexi bacterium]|nr:DMT family transporter [Chloroflexota bacterium]MCI0574596.1 DMT family transporter [Chloroflexota bacterium]MCI0644052.1 DMT family transporter [Chloroflexota bacterium]MCI0731726.1 DMT family transporter [Chloroflexota bacterium]
MFFKRLSPHARAVLQAMFVTFLWATSWVLIKIGLEDIPALSFAGLRYALAFLVLLPLVLRPAHLATLRGLSWRAWLRLAVLGLLYYAITQGSQFVGLAYLPAITTSLLLSFSAVLVALLGIVTLGERPVPLQWAGTGLYLVGVLIYFYPVVLPAGQTVGIVATLVGVAANAVSAVLGRYVNRSLTLAPMVITVVSMGIGAIVLLVSGVAVQGLPRLTWSGLAIVLWLAVVNSAYAFTLWNHTLRTLSAMESSIINNTMMIQIPILAWLFLGEEPTERQIVGMVAAGVGIFVVQLRRQQKASTPPVDAKVEA